MLADDVGGPVHGTNQHAELASGPDLIIVVLSKISHFAYRLVKTHPKLAMPISGAPLQNVETECQGQSVTLKRFGAVRCGCR